MSEKTEKYYENRRCGLKKIKYYFHTGKKIILEKLAGKRERIAGIEIKWRFFLRNGIISPACFIAGTVVLIVVWSSAATLASSPVKHIRVEDTEVNFYFT